MGGTVTRAAIRLTIVAVLAAAPAGSLVAAPALAGNAVGGCTNSYQEYSYGDVSTTYPDVVSATGDILAGTVAPIVDGNHDGLICYKPYPNGSHNNGAGGNLVDNTSGPHAT